MKRVLTIILAALSFTFVSNAQEVALPKGSNVISAGLGVFSSFTNIAIPPICIQYENIVAEFGEKWGVGVGATGGFMALKNLSETTSGGGIYALGDIHYSPIQAIDIYGGMGIGYLAFAVDGIKSNGIGWTPLVGARYFFNDTFGLGLQFGGLGFLNLGISFKI